MRTGSLGSATSPGGGLPGMLKRNKETRMRLDARTMFAAALLAGCAALSACGGKDNGGNSVQMNDMEVVDGTATDAMTDLDGVQSEGTAVALPAANAGSNASPPVSRPAASADKGDDAEVVADQ